MMCRKRRKPCADWQERINHNDPRESHVQPPMAIYAVCHCRGIADACVTNESRAATLLALDGRFPKVSHPLFPAGGYWQPLGLEGRSPDQAAWLIFGDGRG